MRRYDRDTNKEEFGMELHTVERVPLHWHGFYEIELCTQGEGYQYVNGVRSRMEPGVITFLTPKDFHRIEGDFGSISLFNLFFYSHVLPPNVISLIGENKPPFCIKLTGEEYDDMLSRYKALEKEQKNKDEFHDRSLKCQIESICIDIIRSALADRRKYESRAMTAKENKTFSIIADDVIPYINEHYSENPSRDEMASRSHLNPSYFSEVFKRRFGISYSDYLTNVRMAEAMRMLKYTDKSVNEIMDDIGYRSPTAFYKKFKECYDMLPGDVRRNSDEY